MESNFVLNLITSIGTVSVTGVIFFMWLNNKFINQEKEILENKREILRLENEIRLVLNKEDYKEYRVEDKKIMEKIEFRLEEKIRELSAKVDKMPNQIVEQLKTFIK